MGEVPSPTEELPSPLQLEEEANASDTAREVEGQPMRRPRTPPQVWRLDDSSAEEEDSIDGEFDEEQTAGQTACRLGDSKTGLPRATEHDLSTLAAALDDVLGSMATGVSGVCHAKLPYQGLSNLSNQPLAKHLEAPPHSRAPPSRAPPHPCPRPARRIPVHLRGTAPSPSRDGRGRRSRGRLWAGGWGGTLELRGHPPRVPGGDWHLGDGWQQNGPRLGGALHSALWWGAAADAGRARAHTILGGSHENEPARRCRSAECRRAGRACSASGVPHDLRRHG